MKNCRLRDFCLRVDRLPEEAPQDAESWQDVMEDIEKHIMPGVTHWWELCLGIWFTFERSLSLSLKWKR